MAGGRAHLYSGRVYQLTSDSRLISEKNPCLLFLFFICLYASVPGAIVGAGGGVIIKAILDLFNLPLFQPSALQQLHRAMHDNLHIDPHPRQQR